MPTNLMRSVKPVYNFMHNLAAVNGGLLLEEKALGEKFLPFKIRRLSAVVGSIYSMAILNKCESISVVQE